MGVVVVLISILPWLHSWRTRYLQGHGWHHTVAPGTCCAIGPVAATILADKVAVYQRRDDTSWLPVLRLSGEAKTIVAFANVWIQTPSLMVDNNHDCGAHGSRHRDFLSRCPTSIVTPTSDLMLALNRLLSRPIGFRTPCKHFDILSMHRPHEPPPTLGQGLALQA
ncbi:hypothetical protein IWZ01DRAFT_324340 [Phyllosticta capitalensis]